MAVTAVSLALCHSNKANSCVAKSDGLFVVVQLKSFIFDAQTIYHSSQIGMHVACRAFRFYMNLQKGYTNVQKGRESGLLKADKRAGETVWSSAPPIKSFIFSNPVEKSSGELDSDKAEGD